MAPSWLFVMWAGGGNVGPFLALAEHLRARGHRVAAVAPSALDARLSVAGVAPAGTTERPLPGARDVLSAVERHSPDALVVDYMLTDALCGAERSGLPWVALIHTLYRQLLVDGAPHPIGMAGPVAAVNETRAAVSLAPVVGHGDLLTAADLLLVAAPRELDAPGDVPANLAYAGALFEGPGPDRGWMPPPGTDPLVVVSTGTAGDPAAETGLLERILLALAALPVRGFVTLPRYIDAADLRPPANVTVSSYVRHAAVLPHADLLVTHAGLGSVVAGLAHGLPLVCLPLGREQPDNARAVERIGAGLSLPPDAPAEAIRIAIAESLARPAPVRIEPTPAHAVALLEKVAAG